jgi:hypothetical protein
VSQCLTATTTSASMALSLKTWVSPCCWSGAFRVAAFPLSLDIYIWRSWIYTLWFWFFCRKAGDVHGLRDTRLVLLVPELCYLTNCRRLISTPSEEMASTKRAALAHFVANVHGRLWLCSTLLDLWWPGENYFCFGGSGEKIARESLKEWGIASIDSAS